MRKTAVRHKKGVTLVELIVSLALFTIIVALTFNMLYFGMKAQGLATEEFDLQSSARVAMQTISESIRYSSAVFTISKSRFNEGNLTEDWDYIGLSPDGKEVVQYTFDGTKHIKSVLLAAQPEITYRLVFKKATGSNDDKLLQIFLEATKDGKVINQIELESKLEALNSLQIVDRGSLSDPAVAIAYRSKDKSYAVKGVVTLVLDTSGSMDWSLGGGSATVNNKRITILKNETKKLIDGFAQEENISLSLVPFSYSANNPSAYYDVANQITYLKAEVDRLNADGGTNTGDGIRRAYYNMVNYESDNPNTVVRHYLVVLVDGVSTVYSCNSDSTNINRMPSATDLRNISFFMGDGNINNTRYSTYGTKPQYNYHVNGNALDLAATEYVNLAGAMVRDMENARSYVIGFTGVNSELESVNNIAQAIGAPVSNVYKYSPSLDLNAIFEAIRQDIVNDLWLVNGPDW